MRKGWSVCLIAAILISFIAAGCGPAAEGGGTSSSTTRTLDLFGTNSYDSSTSIASSKNSAVYVAGYTFGPMAGSNAGLADSFLVKYSSSGERLWARQLGSEADDYASSVAMDSDDNAYVAGTTGGSIDGSLASGKDIFLAKYSSAGELKWVHRYGSDGHDIATGITFDEAGNFYVTGYTSGSLYGKNLGGADAFIAKFDGEGQPIWAVQTGSAGYDHATAVAASAPGDVFITGYTYGSVGANTASGGPDIFLLKYGPNGQNIWARQFGSVEDDYASSISIGPAGEIYLSAETDGVINGAGPGMIVAMLGTEGYISWATGAGAIPDAWPFLTIDESGKLFLAGEEGTDGDDASTVLYLKAFGPAGEARSSRELSVSGDDHAAGVAVYGADAYIAGNSASGDHDVFIVKMKAD